MHKLRLKYQLFEFMRNLLKGPLHVTKQFSHNFFNLQAALTFSSYQLIRPVAAAEYLQLG